MSETRGRRAVTLSEDEIEALIARGAEQGSKRVLQGLGVDVEEPLKMQRDFAWMRNKREASEKLVDAGKLAMLTAIIGAVVTALAGGWNFIAKAAAGLGGLPPHHP